MAPAQKPSPNKGWARLQRSLRAVHRDLFFRWAMWRFLRDPSAFVDPAHPGFIRLMYGWGNPSWVAGPYFLAGCIAAALAADGPILECGTGLSTILLGAIVKSRGGQLWSLEHEQDWATKTRRYLDLYRLEP